MKAQAKRMMAWILSAMIIVGMMPLQAFAQGEQDAVAVVQEMQAQPETAEEETVATEPQAAEAEAPAVAKDAAAEAPAASAAPETPAASAAPETPAAEEVSATPDEELVLASRDVSQTAEEQPAEEEIAAETTPEEDAAEEKEVAVDPDKKFAYRLLVGFAGQTSVREEDVLLGSFDNVALLGFDSADALNEAKDYYRGIALFASVDGEVKASAETSAATNVDSAGASVNAQPASVNENPISEAAETDAVALSGKVVALVDTGVSGVAVAETLSVMGDAGADENGHGSTLARIIAEENPAAKIVSIKALDANGRGSVASVYAAIQLASESGADIIALPFSARGSSAAINMAIARAKTGGAVVLAAAGNDGGDAANYCPANAGASVAVGALDEEGNPAAFSNTGSAVQAWAKADSTSEATARVAAGLSAGKALEEYAIGAFAEKEDGASDEEAEEFETAYKTTTDDLVDGGVYIIRLRKAPTRSLVQNTGSYYDGNPFVLSNNEKREDSSGQFKLQKINYNFYIKLRDNTGYIMSPEGGATKLGQNGQKVHMWAKSSSNYQSFDQWYMQRNGNYYRISNGSNTGMHLQTEGAGTDGGTACHLWNATSGEQGDWIFERVHYYVKFNGNGNTGGSMSNQKIWQEVSTALTANAFTKTGYTFNGWNTNSSGTGTNYGNKASVKCLTATNAATVNLYAKWVANSYTVKYDGNGSTGGSTANSSHTYNTAKALTTNGFTRTGYTFNGWNTKADGTGTAYANGASVKNLTATAGGTVTLYAQWTPITYTVAYNGNGSTGGSTASSTHTYDVAKNLTTNGFTRTGYSFSGWNTNAAGTGTAYGAGAAVKNLRSSAGTFQLYAQWAANTYALTLDNHGAQEAGTKAVYYKYFTNAYFADAELKTPLTNITIPARAGYTFGGYFSAPEGAGTQYITAGGSFINDPYKLTGATLYAKWTPNEYDVFMDANGGHLAGTGISPSAEETATATAVYDQVITVHHPVREGYEFAGWTISGMEEGVHHEIGPDESTASTVENVTAVSFKDLRSAAGTVTFLANWTPVCYTVRFDAHGGSLAEETVNPLTAVYDEDNSVAAPTRPGYVFTGWKVTGMEGSSHRIGDETFDDATYTYTVDAEDEEVSFRNLRSREGETEFTAVWADDSYKVSFDLNGGSHDEVADGEVATHKYGESYYLANPTKAGYRFTGWTVSGMDAGTEHMVGGMTVDTAEVAGVTGTSFSKLNAAGAGVKEGTEPVHMRATWREADVTVALVARWADEGSAHTTEINYTYTKDGYYADAEHETALEGPIAVPSRAHYEFTGYFEASDGTGTPVIDAEGNIPADFSSRYTAARNLYAGWAPRMYAVTLEQEDATVPGTEKVYEKYNDGIFADAEGHEELSSVTVPFKDVKVDFDGNGADEDPASELLEQPFAGYYDGETALIGAGGQLLAPFTATYFNEDASLIAGWNEASLTLPNLERESYSLEGWFTEAEGGEKVGEAGELFNTGEDATLYAHWIEDPELYYAGNGSTGGSMSAMTIAKGKTLYPAENGFERKGYSFVDWNTAADGSGNSYKAGVAAVWQEDLPAGTGNYTLYAQWKKNELGTVKAIAEQKYTGSAVTPHVAVLDKEGFAVSEDEYTLRWSDNVKVGEATVTVTPAADGNYAWSDAITATFRIIKAEAEYFDEADTNYSGFYDGTAHVVKATAATEDEGHSYRIGYGRTEEEAEAAAAEAASATGNDGYPVKDVTDSGTIYYYIIPDNYEAFGGTLTASVTPKELTVAGLATKTRDYDGTQNAELLSEDARLQGVEDDDEVSLDATQAEAASAGSKAGTHKVSVEGLALRGADAANYTLAQPSDVTIEITRAPVRIGWQDASFVYNGTAKTYDGASVAGGVVEGETVTIGSLSGNVATSVGSYTARVESLAGDDAANYRVDAATATHGWQITKADNEVTVDISDWTYGKTAHTPTATAVYGKDTVVFTYSADGENWSSEQPTSAGSYKVKATVGATNDYNEASATKDFHIYRAKVTVLADDAQSVRGQELTSEIGFEISGELKESDRESLSALIGVTTDAEKDVAGWYDTIADWKNEGETDSNYSVTFLHGIYTVTRSESKVVAHGYSGTYDGQAHGITVSVTQPEGTPADDSAKIYFTDNEDGFEPDIVADLETLKTITEEESYCAAYEQLSQDLEGHATASPTLTNAGSKTVHFIVLSSQTNPDVIVDEKLICVTPAELTVKAKDHTITYGDAAANAGVEYEGFVNDEDESVLTGTVQYDYQGYVAGSDAGKYDVTPAGLEANNNYDITYLPGTLTVAPRTAELVWLEPLAFNFNGTERKVTATVGNAFNNDPVIVAAYDNNAKVAVGNYTATATQLGGSKAGNYTLAGSNTTEQAWEIREMDNSVSVTMADWTYGEAAAEPVVTTAAGLDEDKAVIEYFDAEGESLGQNKPTAAGDYKVRATLDTTDEYHGSSDEAEFAIAKRPVTILADNKASAFGESLKPLTWQMSGSAAYGDDLAIELHTVATSSSKAGVYDIKVSHADNDNYEITTKDGTYTIIKAKMSVSASGFAGDYDGAAHGVTVSLDPDEEGRAAVYYSTQPLTEENYKSEGTTDPAAAAVTRVKAGTTTVYYYVESDYYYGDPAITGSVDIVINKLPLAVRANDSEIVYGDEAGNKGVSYKGFVNGEDASVLTGSLDYSYAKDGTAYAPGKTAGAVGSYDILPEGLRAENYDITFEKGSMTVRPLSVSFSWDKDSFAYDGESHGPEAVIANALEGDDVSPAAYVGNEAVNAGGYVAEITSIGGADAANYVLLPDEKTDSHQWKITKSDNVWKTEPSIDNWTYGKTAAKPASAAAFGNDTVVYEYRKAGAQHAADAFRAEVPTEAGSYILRATIPGTDNYRPLSGTCEFRIEKAQITITADDNSSMYRSDIEPLTATVTGDYVEGDELGIVLETDASLLGDVGEYTITVDWDKNPNYEATLVKGKYTITKGYLTVSATDTEYVYDGEPHGISVSAVKPTINDAVIWYAAEEITEENLDTVEKTRDPLDDSVAITDVGSKTVYYCVVSSNFEKNPEEGDALTGSKTVTITKRDLEVSVTDQNITYGDEPGAGAPVDEMEGVAYTIPSGCADDLDISKLAYSYDYEKYGDVGSYDITADGITSRNYNIIYKSGKLNVGKYTLGFVWEDEEGGDDFGYEYDGEEHSVKAVPQTLNGDVIGELTYENNRATEAGDYTAVVTAMPETGKGINYRFDPVADDSSQEWGVEQAANSWISEPEIEGWTYGEEPKAPKAEARFGNDTVEIMYRPADSESEEDWSAEVPARAGEYDMRARVPGTGNYKELVGYATFDIDKATITVTTDDEETAYLEDIARDTTAFEVSGDYQEGDDLDVVLSWTDDEGGELAPTTHVGVYEIKAEVTNKEALNNYEIEYEFGKYTITRAPLAYEAKGWEGIYDACDHAMDVTVEMPETEGAEEPQVFYSLTDFRELLGQERIEDIEKDLTGESVQDLLAQFDPSTEDEGGETKEPGALSDRVFGESPRITNVADSATVYCLIVSENYHILPDARDVTVRRAPLQIAANDNAIIFGDLPAANGITCDGFVGGEDESVLDGELVYDFDYEQFGDVGEYAISPKGLVAENYKITFTDGKLTVSPLAIHKDMLNMPETEFVYNGSAHSPAYELAFAAEDEDGEEVIYTLHEGRDYSVDGDTEGTALTTYQINFTGEGNFRESFGTNWRVIGEETKETYEEGNGEIIVEKSVFSDDLLIQVEGLTRELALSLLDEEELARVREGGEPATLYLEISKVDGLAEEDAEPTAALLEKLGAGTCAYLEIKVWKKVGDDLAKPIHDLGGNELTFTTGASADEMDAPAGSERRFYVIRAHEGVATVLAGPTDQKTFAFSSSLFSGFTIAYRDSKLPDDNTPEKPEDTKSRTNTASTTSAQAPKTGDASNVSMWCVLLAGAGAALYLALRRRREEEGGK